MSHNQLEATHSVLFADTEEWIPVDETMLETLLVELNSDSPELRKHALEMLSTITDSRTATLLKTALQHEDPRVRLLVMARLNQFWL